MIKYIKTIAVYVSDQSEAVVFYTEKVGLEVRRRESGQFALFGSPAEERPAARVRGGTVAPAPSWSRAERLSFEKEALGFYITGHPLAGYEKEARRYASTTCAQVAGKRNGDRKSTRLNSSHRT